MEKGRWHGRNLWLLIIGILLIASTLRVTWVMR